jgi:hypothetical protein
MGEAYDVDSHCGGAEYAPLTTAYEGSYTAYASAALFFGMPCDIFSSSP